MKTLLRARPLAPKKNDSIHAPFTRGSGTPQGTIGQEQRRHGRTVQSCQWPAVAAVSVNRPEQQSRNGDAHAFLRNGSARAGCGDVRPDIESDARGRRDGRPGQVVANAGHVPALPAPILIIREALRAAALAPTYQEALDVTGDALRRLAELARAEVSRG